MDGDAWHLLRCPVARDAEAQKLPLPGGVDAVRAELRGNREVERELRDDGRFLACAIADDVECLSNMFNAEFHGVIHYCRIGEAWLRTGGLSTAPIVAFTRVAAASSVSNRMCAERSTFRAPKSAKNDMLPKLVRPA